MIKKRFIRVASLFHSLICVIILQSCLQITSIIIRNAYIIRFQTYRTNNKYPVRFYTSVAMQLIGLDKYTCYDCFML
jgi:hypothetical protein